MHARPVAVALLLLVAAVAPAGCADEPPAGTATGPTVLEGSDTTTVAGTEVPVVVPAGSFSFTVGEPTADLPDDVTGQADADTSYVGVAWQPDGLAPEHGPVLHGTSPETAAVRVRQGDAQADVTELGPPAEGGTSSGVVWVSVADGGPDPTLEVEYDGLVQRFDLATGEREPGPADGFYDDTGTARVDCPDGAPTAAEPGWRYAVGCEVTDVAAVPYVAGQGWAGEGRTWLVLGVTLSPSPFRWAGSGGSATYAVDRQAGEVTVDGRPAAVLSEGEPLADGWSAAVAAQVEAAAPVTVQVDRTYELTRDDGPPAAPRSHEVRFTTTLDLPPSTS